MLAENAFKDGSNLQWISQRRMEDLVNSKLAYEVPRVDPYRVIITPYGREVRVFAYQQVVNPGKGGDREWALVGTYAVVQFGSMPADMVEKAVEKSTRPEAADRWVVYFSDRNLKNARLKGLQTAEFIASIAPISSTSTAILDGRFVDAAISFVGDIAFAGAFRGLWIGKAAAQASNAAKLAQANTAILRFQSIQSVIVVTAHWSSGLRSASG